MKMNEKVKDIIGVTIFAIFIFGFIIGIYFLGFVGVSKFLGVEYDSLWSLAIFVISVFVIGFFVEIIFDALTVLAVEKVSDYLTAFIIQFLFLFVSEWIVLAAVEAVMESVTLSEKTILILAAILALLGTIFDNKKKKLEETQKIKN